MTIQLPLEGVAVVSFAANRELLGAPSEAHRPMPYLVDGFRFAFLRANAMLFGGGLLALTSYNAFAEGTRYGYLPAAIAVLIAGLGIRDLTKIL